jgi:hypothetical protein
VNLRLPHLLFIGVVLVLGLWVGWYDSRLGIAFVLMVGASSLRLRYPRSLHRMHRNEYAAESRTQRRRRSIQKREEWLTNQRVEERGRKGR